MISRHTLLVAGKGINSESFPRNISEITPNPLMNEDAWSDDFHLTTLIDLGEGLIQIETHLQINVEMFVDLGGCCV